MLKGSARTRRRRIWWAVGGGLALLVALGTVLVARSLFQPEPGVESAKEVFSRIDFGQPYHVASREEEAGLVEWSLTFDHPLDPAAVAMPSGFSASGRANFAVDISLGGYTGPDPKGAASASCDVELIQPASAPDARTVLVQVLCG